jgi:hypothetical protein
MSAGVVSRGMFTVLEMAPDRKGCAAAIICTWACQRIDRTPSRGLNAQSKTGRCWSLSTGAPSIVSFLST